MAHGYNHAVGTDNLVEIVKVVGVVHWSAYCMYLKLLYNKSIIPKPIQNNKLSVPLLWQYWLITAFDNLLFWMGFYIISGSYCNYESDLKDVPLGFCKKKPV